MTNKKPKFSNAELVKTIANEFKLGKSNATDIVKRVHQLIIEKASDQNYDGVQIFEFGIFRVKEVAPRAGRNPLTGEGIDIPASKRLVFKQSSSLKGAL